MTPADLLNSLVAVYPPEGTLLERTGALKGDRRTVPAQMPRMIKVMSCPMSLQQCAAYLNFGDRICMDAYEDISFHGLDSTEFASAQGTDFFDQFDTDGDGYICFGEYLLIVTFLAIPLEVHLPLMLWVLAEAEMEQMLLCTAISTHGVCAICLQPCPSWAASPRGLCDTRPTR